MLFAGTSAMAAEPEQYRNPPSTLEEITVTAQKRVESLQKASAAITAISGDQLVTQGLRDLRAVQDAVPSVRFQIEAANTQVYIRGVGSVIDFPNVDPPSTFLFNGVYVPREGTGMPLFDIAQIEVLPGPQGTLYGRNAIGGVVNLTSKRPTDKYETKVVVESGNYSLIHGTVMQNLPVSNTLALRAAVDYTEHDGFQTSGADSQQDLAGRLSAAYKPNDDLSIYVFGQMSRKYGHLVNAVRIGFNDGTFSGDPSAFETGNPWNDVITPEVPKALPSSYESAVLGGEVQWNVGDLTLTYTPGFTFVDYHGNYFLESAPSLMFAHGNQLTQELRLSGESGKLSWLVGAYAYRMSNEGLFTVGGFPLMDVTQNKVQGIAGFGQATYDLTDAFRMTVGGRYSSDKRKGAGRTGFGVPYSGDSKFSHFDPKIGLEYDVAPSAMLYATFQTGYQPGTFNLFPSQGSQSNFVNEAKIGAVSVGIKSRFFDDKLQINNEVFYYDYKDLFVQSFNLNTALLYTFNAEKVEVYGDQLDVVFKPTDRDRFSVSLGYLHARNKTFLVPAEINIGTPQRDFAGYPLPFAPDWTLSAGYHHDFPIGDGNLRIGADTRYESSFWATFAQNRGTRQKGYTKSNASISYIADTWSLGAWIRNIENEAVISSGAGGLAGPYAISDLLPPRTYGLRLTVDF